MADGMKAAVCHDELVDEKILAFGSPGKLAVPEKLPMDDGTTLGGPAR
jgi:hypothetical protein